MAGHMIVSDSSVHTIMYKLALIAVIIVALYYMRELNAGTQREMTWNWSGFQTEFMKNDIQIGFFITLYDFGFVAVELGAGSF